MVIENKVDKKDDPGANARDQTKNKEALDNLKMEELVNQNTEMRTQLGELKETIMSPQYQEFIDSQKSKPGQFDRGDFRVGQQEIDLETMDRNQFAQHLMGLVGNMVGNASKQQDAKIGKIDISQQKEQLRRSIDSARTIHKDFDTHTSEMSKISLRIEREGGVSADDLYRIATHPGPGKPKDEPPVTKVEKPGGGAAGDEKPPADETPKQAAERIYDEIVGNKG